MNDVRNSDQKTPLHSASYKGHITCVRLLLSSPHIDVHIQNDWGKTAFGYTSEYTIRSLIMKEYEDN